MSGKQGPASSPLKGGLKSTMPGGKKNKRDRDDSGNEGPLEKKTRPSGKPERKTKKQTQPNLEELYLASVDLLTKDLEDRRTKALRSGEKPYLADYGVYILGLQQSSISNGNLAGYLNLNNALLLNDIADSIKEPMKRMAKLAQGHFGLEGVSEIPNLVPSILFRRLADGNIQADDVLSNEEPDAMRYPTNAGTNRNRYYLHMMRFVRDVMKILNKKNEDEEFPLVFSGPHDPTVSRTYIHGLNWEAEDIYRGILIYFWLCTRFRKARQPGSTTEGQSNFIPMDFEDQNSRGVYKGLPVLPLFVVPNRGGGDSAQNLATQGENMHQRILQHGIDLTGISLMQQFASDVDDDTAANTLDKMMRDRKGPATLTSQVDNFDDQSRRLVMKHVSQHAEVLYEDPRYQDKSFFGTMDRERVSKEKEVEADALTAMQEEGIDEEDKKYKELQGRFLKLQANLNRNTAIAPSFRDAEIELNLEVQTDLEEPDPTTERNFSIKYENLPLKPWQGPGSNWQVKMALSPLRVCILADDTGLGKTVTTLVTVCELARRRERDRLLWGEERDNLVDGCVRLGEVRLDGEDPMTFLERVAEKSDLVELGHEPRHRPVLVCVPPTALYAWIRDIEDKFRDEVYIGRNINLYTFCNLGGAKATASERERAIKGVKGSKDRGLSEFIDRLDPYDAQTSRTVILTTFQSFQKSVMKKFRMAPNDTTHEEDNDDDDDDDDDEEIEKDAEQKPVKSGEKFYRAFNSRSDLFSLRIIDEAHKVKDPKALQSRALLAFRESACLMLTATPMKNSVRDLAGLLLFLFQHIEKDLERVDRPSFKEVLDLRIELEEEYGGDFLQIPKEHFPRFGVIFDPDLFKTLLSSQGTNDEVKIGAQIIPPYTMMTVLRRVKGTKLTVCDEDIIVASEIPRYEIRTVELIQGALERELYKAILEHTKAMNDEPIIIATDDEEAVISVAAQMKRRRLGLSTMNVSLDMFSQRKVDMKADVVHKHSSGGIDSWTFFHTWTKSDLHVLTPANRLEIIQYIVGKSVKCQYLIQLMIRHYIDAGEKMIIWANEPMTVWLTELILTVLDIRFASIHAGVSDAMRVKAERDFNQNPEVGIIVCSSRSCQESMNLQWGGHIQVFIDVVSASATLQMVGRSHRIGQTHRVIVYRLTVDETYDQVLQANYNRRFRGNIAAQAEVSPDQIDRIMKNMTHYDRRLMEQQGLITAQEMTVWATKGVRGAYADAMQRELFGIRSNRGPAWEDVFKPTAKNIEPDELAFRIVLGGTVCRAAVRDFIESKEQPKEGPSELDPADEKNYHVVKELNPYSAPRVDVKPPPVYPVDRLARLLIDMARLHCSTTAAKIDNMSVKDTIKKFGSWVPLDQQETYLISGSQNVTVVQVALHKVSVRSANAKVQHDEGKHEDIDPDHEYWSEDDFAPKTDPSKEKKGKSSKEKPAIQPAVDTEDTETRDPKKPDEPGKDSAAAAGADEQGYGQPIGNNQNKISKVDGTAAAQDVLPTPSLREFFTRQVSNFTTVAELLRFARDRQVCPSGNVKIARPKMQDLIVENILSAVDEDNFPDVEWDNYAGKQPWDSLDADGL